LTRRRGFDREPTNTEPPRRQERQERINAEGAEIAESAESAEERKSDKSHAVQMGNAR